MSITAVKAQEHTDAAGGDATGAGGSVSYSIGQIDYPVMTGSGGIVTQGVQQPYEILVLSGNNIAGINLSISVHPNPATEFIILKTDVGLLDNLSYSIYDIQGKLLDNKKVENSETTISVSEFSKSIYFFKLFSNEKEIKTFKVIKN
jgi:hypothetical protein